MRNSLITKMWALLVCAFFWASTTHAQINPDTVQAGMYDMGKMWTFDYPPKDFFKQTYGFDADEKWFEETRLAALRFASYCSASFVSANGLVMTNHHCARESGTDIQRPGENFNETGFFAKKQEDERKVEGLYVDQLVKIIDMTSRIQDAMAKGTSDAEQLKIRRAEYDAIVKEYKEKDGFKGLELQVVRFYNGGKYSLYGFKRYNDVRLVFMPELQLGFYGGDYDNFTYPRYALDCSFFRVYDEAGKPLKTEHYYRFNPEGAKEGEPVFVVGNPGSTNRLQTISDLEYRRDVQMPLILSGLRNQSSLLKGYNESVHSDSILNLIFGLENSIKALGGIYEGMKDPYLMARKGAFEKKFRADAAANPKTKDKIGSWDEIATANLGLRSAYPPVSVFTSEAGDLFTFATGVLEAEGNPKAIEELRTTKLGAEVLSEGFLALHLQSALNVLGASDPYVVAALGGLSSKAAAAKLVRTTRIKDATFREGLLMKDSAGLASASDPILDLARMYVARQAETIATYRSFATKQQVSRQKIGRMVFDLYGTAVSPDATFSLRINDGVVKGYEYNGTIAPPFTTFYGLYDRYYSFKGSHKDWELPARWLKPTPELLTTRMDFVTTNDIIGGNSGSPMINKNREVVGLAFDGNMESLPGEFIYTPDGNRTVGVHAGGMIAALRDIYKAKRLVTELLAK